MKQLNLRLPDDVHAKLAAMAASDRRSLNSMAILLIEKADQDRGSPGP
jgi:predicted HicB family RNase H-like nuclease